MSRKLVAGFVAAIVVAVILLLVRSMSGYGEVSEQTYQFATAAYGACRARSPERIAKFEEMLNDEGFRAELSKQEFIWCEGILSNAQNEQWTSAANAAKRIMEDQVKH